MLSREAFSKWLVENVPGDKIIEMYQYADVIEATADHMLSKDPEWDKFAFDEAEYAIMVERNRGLFGHDVLEVF